MYSKVIKRAEKLVAALPPSVMAGRMIGLEKESLRVSASGLISQADHPQALGSALTHPHITTDFSEALLEMVTPPCSSAKDALDFLQGIHHFIVDRLPDNEHLWNTSMPCILRGGQSVRIGEYGSSHNGLMKHAYRRGLGLRYGRRMQAIAGIHFNFSLPKETWVHRQALLSDQQMAHPVHVNEGMAGGSQSEITNGYFQMAQNLIRIGWVVPYLFGASPAICSSFLNDGEGEEFATFNQSTRYAPFGTSLRMGKIGYRYNDEEPIDLSVDHHDINTYINDIIGHVSSVHPPYKKLGLRDEAGVFQQLSCARLQIENEYYSTVRPKQIAEPTELPIHALQERGIRYLELRSVDVNLLDPLGINLAQVAMLEMLMVYAWLTDPAPLSAQEMQSCKDNIQTVAHRGREPGLQLSCGGTEVNLAEWGEAILDVLEPIASWLDRDQQTPLYVPTVEQQRAKFRDASLTPSAQLLAGIKRSGSFFDHAQQLSKQHAAWLKNQVQDESVQATLLDEVALSIAKQAEMEQTTEGNFDQFLANYLGQIHPG